MDAELNYTHYSLEELQDAYAHIDKQAYPERAQALYEEIQSRVNRSGNPERQHEDEEVTRVKYVTPKGNWIKLHWQGRLTLAVSYWVNIVAFDSALIFLSTKLFDYFGESSAEGPLRGFVILAFYLFVVVMLVWQLVGLYRSADMHTSRGGTAGWAVIAKIMVLVGITRFSYEMSETGIPIIKESASLITGTAALEPIYIRVMNNATEVELQGQLEFGTAERLKQVLADNPSIEIIHLNSTGGRLVEAEKLVAIVKKNKLITYTKTQCLSACPLVFLAGKERLLAEDASLGFHSASFGEISGSEYEEFNEELIDMLENEGVPYWFVSKVSKVSSDDMWYPTTEELIEAEIIDKLVDSGDYASSGVYGWEDPADDGLLENVIYKAMSEYDVEAFDVIRSKMRKGIQQGIPMNKVRSEINEYLYNQRLSYYLSSAGDASVVSYMLTQLNQMRYLQPSHPDMCAAILFPELFSSDVSDNIYQNLTTELIDAENNAIAALVNSLSSTHIATSEAESEVLMRQIVQDLIQANESYQAVLVTPEAFVTEPDKLCTVAIEFNSKLAALPKEKAGLFIRGLYKS